MNKSILTILGALILSSVAFASVPVTSETIYASKFLDKGTISGPIVTSTLGANYESFAVEVKAYAPTTIASDNFKTALSRLDVTGGYTLKSTLFDVTLGDTFKNYSHPAKTSMKARNQPFVKLQSKGLSLIGRYDIQTRNMNTEAAYKQSVEWNGFKLTPSVYLGYSDISDQFPHSLKAIKQSNRYYGGGVAASHKALGGNLTLASYYNRSDISFNNTSFFWTAGYAVKF